MVQTDVYREFTLGIECSSIHTSHAGALFEQERFVREEDT